MVGLLDALEAGQELPSGLLPVLARGLGGVALDVDLNDFAGASPEALRDRAARQYLAAALLTGVGFGLGQRDQALGTAVLLEAKSLSAAGSVALTRSESSESEEHVRVLRYQQAVLSAMRAGI
ncbi:MAG: hypothetical protein GY913_07680 [Proteobacteria bacterium]|nr:hypothetical protein [Pseudomonadota bacterium]MCP4916791.1 hypothetical protein [Pseudomonadota bacterium]